MKSKAIATVFGIAYALLIGSAFSQPTEEQPLDEPQSVAGAQRDDAQDAAQVVTDSKQEVTNAIVQAQVQSNTEALAIMNARNQFWLQVLQTIMPILSGIGIAIVGWLQLKAARERQLMANSINGLKTELVASTRAAAFFEGAKMEADRHTLGEITPATARGIELSEAARLASIEAHRVAAIGAGEKQPTKSVEVETLTIAPGGSSTSEATPGGGAVVTKDT